MFHDFAIANYAKDLDVGALAGSARYRYKDENDATGQTMDAVDLTWTGAVSPGSPRGPVASSVVAWGARYFEAQPSNDCRILGFKSTGDEAAYGLIASTGAETAQRLYKSVSGTFARSLINRAANPYTRLGAVVAGLTDPANFTYTFACGGAQLQIVRPSVAQKAFVGDPVAPERFLIIVNVSGPAELGSPSVEGLDTTDFTVFVGAEDPANQAAIVSGAYVQGSYWLVAQAPTKPSDGDYPLLVKLADLSSDTKEGVVRYAKLTRDQALVIDNSGSMNAPAGNTKLDAAKNAAGLFVDAASTEDFLGVVRFSGDGVEPNNDAVTIHQLQTIAGQRGNAKNPINGLVPDSLTSIGDGLKQGQQELTLRGRPEAQDFIVLLSDGMENEADFWATVRPTLVASGTVVHSIALGPQADQALMQEIASTTGGDYLYVDLSGASPALTAAELGAATISPSSLALANRLADSYRIVTEAIRRHQRLWESAGNVPAGGAVRLPIRVEESGLTEPVFSFNWSQPTPNVQVDLFRPDGSQVLAGQPGVQIFSDQTHTVYQLDKLDPTGVWHAAISTRTAIDYVATLSAKSYQGVQLDLYLGQVNTSSAAQALNRQFLRGLPMPILAILTDKSGPIRGAKVQADVQHPDGQIDTLQLFDDGNHDDGGANDGIYAGLYTRTTAGSTFGADTENNPGATGTRGSYIVRAVATGRSNSGQAFERHKGSAFQLYEFSRDTKPTETTDTDQDGMPDRYERLHPCLNPNVADAEKDPDGDGLSNLREFQAGPDPCDPDTDRGGESDGSELARRASPLDARDDGVPVPIDVEVVNWIPDHMPPLPLRPNANLIRYPVSRAYTLVRLLRSTNPNGPFSLVIEFDPTRHGGLYSDQGLTNGTTYYYQLVGVGRSGAVSAPSRVFAGTPKDDPFPPIGHVDINRHQPRADSPNVTLYFTADPGTTELIVSNQSSFEGARYEPMVPTKAWTLQPDRRGYSTVFVRYRDAAGNESTIYQDDIMVLPGGSLGAIRGQVTLEGLGDGSGVFVQTPGNGQVVPVLTDPSGRFTLTGLLPATYTVSFERPGFQPDSRSGIAVRAGSAADLGRLTLRSIGPTATPSPTGTATATPTATPTRPVVPILTGLRPPSASNQGTASLTFLGARFQPGARAALIGPGGLFGLGSVQYLDEFNLKAFVPRGLPPGVYEARVTNPDGSESRLPRAFTSVGQAPLPVQVLPRYAFNTSPADLLISGFNIKPGTRAGIKQTTRFSLTVAAETTDVLTDTQQIDDTRLRVTLPQGLNPGDIQIVLIDPETGEETPLPDGFSVASPLNDDLAVAAEDLWVEPATVRVSQTVTLGLNLHRIGGKRTFQVPVAFYLGDPAAGGTLIAQATTVPIPPRTELETVTISWPVGGQEGSFDIYAVVDPGNMISETTKLNNVAVRTIAVLPAAPDTTPPDLADLEVNGRSEQSAAPQVRVDLTAADRGSGLASMYLVERVFNDSARAWIPISSTNWISFSRPFTLTLSDRPGMRFVQAWVADQAGNISLNRQRQLVSYVAPTDTLRANQIRVYRRVLAAGETLSARLEPLSGDADLYIWDPAGNSVLVRNGSGQTVDEGQITATVAGTYQVEVFAYSDTTYRLTIGGGRTGVSAAAANADPTPNPDKSLPAGPVISPASQPEDTSALPIAPIGVSSIDGPAATPTVGPTKFSVFLPAINRDGSGW